MVAVPGGIREEGRPRPPALPFCLTRVHFHLTSEPRYQHPQHRLFRGRAVDRGSRNQPLKGPAVEHLCHSHTGTQRQCVLTVHHLGYPGCLVLASVRCTFNGSEELCKNSLLQINRHFPPIVLLRTSIRG